MHSVVSLQFVTVVLSDSMRAMLSFKAKFWFKCTNKLHCVLRADLTVKFHFARQWHWFSFCLQSTVHIQWIVSMFNGRFWAMIWPLFILEKITMAQVVEGWDIPVNFQKASMVTLTNVQILRATFLHLYQTALLIQNILLCQNLKKT